MILMGAPQEGLPGLDPLYDAAEAKRPAGWDLPRDTIVNNIGSLLDPLEIKIHLVRRASSSLRAR